jgi:hypothetical protein
VPYLVPELPQDVAAHAVSISLLFLCGTGQGYLKVPSTIYEIQEEKPSVVAAIGSASLIEGDSDLQEKSSEPNCVVVAAATGLAYGDVALGRAEHLMRRDRARNPGARILRFLQGGRRYNCERGFEAKA